MAVIQALLAYRSKSVGRILMALFNWAVVALFGQVEGTRKTALTALMAAAAAWPLLLAGVVAPKTAAFVRGVRAPAALAREQWPTSAMDSNLSWSFRFPSFRVGGEARHRRAGRRVRDVRTRPAAWRPSGRTEGRVRHLRAPGARTEGLLERTRKIIPRSDPRELPGKRTASRRRAALTSGGPPGGDPSSRLIGATALRVVSAIRRHRDVYVSLVTSPESEPQRMTTGTRTRPGHEARSRPCSARCSSAWEW